MLGILTTENINMKRTVIFQTGVDACGFPTYVEHHIYQDRPTETKSEPKKRFLSVIQKETKQH